MDTTLESTVAPEAGIEATAELDDERVALIAEELREAIRRKIAPRD